MASNVQQYMFAFTGTYRYRFSQPFLCLHSFPSMVQQYPSIETGPWIRVMI